MYYIVDINRLQVKQRDKTGKKTLKKMIRGTTKYDDRRTRRRENSNAETKGNQTKAKQNITKRSSPRLRTSSRTVLLTGPEQA